MKRNFAGILAILTAAALLAGCQNGPSSAELQSQIETMQTEFEAERESWKDETRRILDEVESEMDALRDENSALQEQLDALESDAEEAAEDTPDAVQPHETVAADTSSQPAQTSQPATPPAASQSQAERTQSSAPAKPPASTSESSEEGRSVTVSLGSGGIESQEERISAAAKKEIVDYAKSYAEEIGLIWAGKPLTGFDPYTTLYGRDLSEVKSFIKSEFDSMKESGYLQVYVQVVDHNNADKLCIYRG